MAFNGDGPHNKRQRTEVEASNHRSNETAASGNGGGGGTANAGFRVGSSGYSSGGGGDEPRRKRQEENKPNHVLLFTVVNPMYPITVEVIHTICQSSGQVLRIVIFKKNGVQAMVEFDSIDSATRAKEALNGANIYSGCCTLKIEFAKPEKLNVHKNDADSWDYTISMDCETADRNNGSAKDGNTNGRPQPLLQEPHFGSRPQPYSGYGGETRYEEYGAGGGPGYGDPYGAPGAGEGYRGGPKGAPPASAPDHRQERPLAPYMLYQQGAVLMVYGLDPLCTNTDKLFNLMCLYGNVARIKFLKTKEGTAMVQMGDNIAVERCVQNLNNVVVAAIGASPKPSVTAATTSEEAGPAPTDHKLQLAFSKQPYLSEVTNPYPLPDKSPSYKEYVTNKNNRFVNPAMASKNRIQAPSKILHFFNTPPQVTEDELINVFSEYDVAPPKAVKLFPMKSERSSSGLLEFETMSEAVAAVMACNHAAIESPGTKFPFIMKLCFSSSRNMSIPKNFDNGNANNGSHSKI